MLMYDVIRKKRDGLELSDDEIRFFISEYTIGNIPDYQAAALMMAIFYKGMTDREIVTLTQAMAHSGDTVDLSQFGGLTADKHSTGGVGDKTSMIVAPIAASLGCKVSKMSGRGLGHTGGTVDKLESIPGYNTALTQDEFLSQVEKIGIAVIGQTGNLTPADKKLYSLRDVTATIDSIPLITSSIMSKKLAAGSHTIVLDVKVGSGAFMKDITQARVLAEKMVSIAKLCGRKASAVLTDMDTPLGMAVGNSLEVIEAVNVLKGNSHGPLREICLALAAEMLAQTFSYSREKAIKLCRESLDSQKAYSKMLEWISAQGGDVSYIENTEKFPKAKISKELLAPTDGYISSIDAEGIGMAAVELGAGRKKAGEAIDHSAGIIFEKTFGDRVSRGDCLCRIYTNDCSAVPQASEKILQAISISDSIPVKNPLIYDIIN